MSTQLQKQQIRQTWDTKKTQQAATQLVANKIASRIIFLQAHDGQDIDEIERGCAKLKATMLKQQGISTPMDLVRYLAEYEVNVFGAEASIGGNDQQAVLFNDKPTVWLEAKKISNLSKDQEQKMQKHYRQWMENLAQFLGLNANVEFATDGNSSRVTFSRN